MNALTSCILGGALVAAAVPAHADPPRVGVELGRTLLAVEGPGVRVALGPVDLEAIGTATFLGGSVHPSWVVGELRALVPIRRWADGWIGVAGGVAVGEQTQPDPDPAIGSFHAVGYGVEAGLHAEWFVVPALSLGFDVGAARAVGGDGAPPFRGSSLGEQSTTRIGRPTGGASLTFWF